MQEEIWKPIKGYEGLYEVSNLGRVKSVDRIIVHKDGSKHFWKGQILKQKLINCGYLEVVLHDTNRMPRYYLVHRLVAEAFLEIPEELKKYIGTRKLQVNHINEFDKTDNRVSNLEWMSAKENTNYGTARQRMIEKQMNNANKSKKVYQYDLEGNLIAVYLSTMDAQRKGFSSSKISGCCLGKYGYKTHKGFIWRYEGESLA